MNILHYKTALISIIKTDKGRRKKEVSVSNCSQLVLMLCYFNSLVQQPPDYHSYEVSYLFTVHADPPPYFVSSYNRLQGL